MNRLLFLLLGLVVSSPTLAQPLDGAAARDHFFPLIADGDGLQSRLFLFVTNSAGMANRCSLDVQGSGMDSSIFGAHPSLQRSGSSASLILESADTSLALTIGLDQPLGFGYAKLNCEGPSIARMLLSWNDAGAPVSMTTLESARPGNSFQVPVLPRLGRQGLLLANDAALAANCAIELFDDAGASVGGANLGAQPQSAGLHFLEDIISFPADFSSGRATIACTGPVAATALPMNRAVFTSLPAIELDVDADGNENHILPLIADGGGFQSQLVVTNLAQADNHCTMNLRGPGLATDRFSAARGVSVSSASEAEFGLSGQGDQIAVLSKGGQTLGFGYATFTCDGPVAASNVLTVGSAGDPAGMAAIQGVGATDSFLFPVAPEAGQLALVFNNDLGPAATCSVELERHNGRSLGRRSLGVPVESTEVRFLNDLFSTPADFAGGVVHVNCDSAVSAASIPQAGAAFTAMPPASPSVDTMPVSTHTIPDANLRAIIAEQLGKGPDDPITESDLAGITRIDAEGAGIASLEGLQFATELTSLSLSAGTRDPETGEYTGRNFVSDMSPILKLRKLRYLRLSNSELTGSIPSGIGGLSELRTLYLFSNKLSGEIPAEIGNLSKLEDIGIWSNELTGEIPAEIGNLTELRRLSASSNRLTGELPTELGNLLNMERISLHNNELNGSIPSELGNLLSLTYLDLGRNELSGVIPPELGNLLSLTHLDLGPNALSGEIPQELGDLLSLTYLDLRGNALSGVVPSEFGQLENLEKIDLSENNLSGLLPSKLEGLSNLESLRLQGNKDLHGSLPWGFREPQFQGNLEIQIGGTQIFGYGSPPERAPFRDYSSLASDNGNASHHSIEYFQGPLMLSWDWAGEKVEYQTPILGRWAVLAVAVSHNVEQPPEVVTQVLDSQDKVLASSLPEAAWPSTTEVGSGEWQTRYFFEMPGSLFQSGNKIVHQIDPEDYLKETDETDNTADPIVIYGSRPPVFRVKFFPIIFEEVKNHDWADELDVERLMSGTHALLPIADNYEAEVSAPYVADLLNYLENGGKGAVLGELFKLWNVEAEPDEFYHGIYFGSIGGIANISGQVAVSEVSVNSVIPHELGHNFSLSHTPGCFARGPDEDYPYPEGGLGSDPGWHQHQRRLVSNAVAGFGDVMSYCTDDDKNFISDYYYRQASEYWLSFGTQSSTSAVRTTRDDYQSANTQSIYSPDAEGSLAFFGTVRADGVWTLEQAQYSNRRSRPPASSESYILRLFDAAGIQLYSEPLGTSSLSEGDEAHWVARTPMPLRAVTEIVILDADGNEVLRETLAGL